jgi:hypothetical protein
MSSLTRPRGPLPRRVYWVRRLLVLGVALLLVLGVGKLLSDSSDGKEESPQARTVGSEVDPAPSTPTLVPSGTPDPTAKGDRKDQVKRTKKKPTPTPLPEPSGPCTAADVVVTASTERPEAGRPVGISLEFTTKQSAACTFAVSPETVVLRVTSGSDRIWTSQQCPKAIPTTTVVARKTEPGKAAVVWHGRRSNESCSTTAQWALPGWYHAEAAAIGADPTDVQFRLYQPTPPTITPTPTPKAKKPRSAQEG